MDILDKLNANTVKDEQTGCWLWQLYKDKKGYGRIKFRFRTTRVHRVSAHIHLGYDLTDEVNQVLHKCQNKHCWNPDHLYIGTHSDNMYDKAMSGNARHGQALSDYCNNGHERAKYIDDTGHCRECDRLRKWRHPE